MWHSEDTGIFNVPRQENSWHLLASSPKSPARASHDSMHRGESGQARKRIKRCSSLLYAQLNRILTPTACKSIRGYRKKIPPFVGLF